MKNKNRFIPVAETYELGPVLVNSFTETRIPLFWGPGLSMSNYPLYTPPDASLWRTGEPLSIPKTVRLMLGVQPEYDSDAYGSTDGGTTPPPPPEPPDESRIWRYEIDPYQFSLFDRPYWATNLPSPGYPFLTLAGDNPPIGPYQPDPYSIRATSYTSSGGPWPLSSPPNVELYNGFTLELLYSGPITGAPGIIISGSRNITWISDNHPFSLLTLYAYGNTDTLSPTIPPRCYYLVPTTTPFWDSGEVPPAVRNFYGCPASPPPLPPP